MEICVKNGEIVPNVSQLIMEVLIKFILKNIMGAPSALYLLANTHEKLQNSCKL